MKTIAETISKQFGDDGWQMVDAAGNHIEDLCFKLCVRWATAPDYERNVFDFADGSALVCGYECWDLGYKGCYCGRDTTNSKLEKHIGHVAR